MPPVKASAPPAFRLIVLIVPLVEVIPPPLDPELTILTYEILYYVAFYMLFKSIPVPVQEPEPYYYDYNQAPAFNSN